MLKKMVLCFGILILVNFACDAMDALTALRIKKREQRAAQAQQVVVQNALAPQALQITVQQRVAAFNEWIKTPDIIKAGIKAENPDQIVSYIHLSMFMCEPEEKAKSPEYLAQATQLAQQICPAYTFWPEHYEIYGRAKRGKAYSEEEGVELNFGPQIKEALRLKMQLALLQGVSPDLVATKPNWKKEAETVKALMQPLTSRSSIVLIPKILPVKREEIRQLKNEIDDLASDPEKLERALVQQKKLHEDSAELVGVKAGLQQLSEKRTQEKHDDERTISEQGQRLKKLEDDANEQRVAFAIMQEEIRAKQTAISQSQEKGQMLEQEKSQISKQAQDFKNRLASLLALFEASKTTGWEAVFVEGLKVELKE
ncbi:hypothetical protein BH09DEP1_BH09DEP1_1710 [soil metagenome]